MRKSSFVYDQGFVILLLLLAMRTTYTGTIITVIITIPTIITTTTIIITIIIITITIITASPRHAKVMITIFNYHSCSIKLTNYVFSIQRSKPFYQF